MTFFTGKKEVLKNGSVTSYESYACKTHVVTGRAECSWHRIYENPLKRIVLEHIKRQAEAIRLDEDGMLERLRDKLIGGDASDKAAVSAERQSLKQELHTIDLTIDKLYEDKITGAVTADRFAEMVSKTEARRLEIAERLDTLEQSETEHKTKLGDIQNWIRLIKEKSVVEAVDRELLETLIERVEIGEPKTENGVKTQDVWVYYNFVGLV